MLIVTSLQKHPAEAQMEKDNDTHLHAHTKMHNVKPSFHTHNSGPVSHYTQDSDPAQ